VSTGRSVGEDVAVESVAAKNEEKLVPPSSVGGGVGVEYDGDQSLDVRDPGSLKVEVGDHGIVRATRVSSPWERSHRRRLLRGGNTLPRRGVEEALRLDDLASKSSEVARSCSLARAATRTRSSAAAASALAVQEPQPGHCWRQ
jgi:hypothetical protein